MKLDTINDNIAAILAISQSPEPDIGARLAAYIDLGLSILGFENGFVSHIQGEDYTVLGANTLDDKLVAGMSFQLCDTLCKEIVETRKGVLHPKLKGTKLYDLAGRKYLDTEAVIGCPVYMHGDIVGTVTFCSITEKQMSDRLEHKYQIVQLLANQIGNLLKVSDINHEFALQRELLNLGSSVARLASYTRDKKTNGIKYDAQLLDIYGLDGELISGDNLLSKMLTRVHPEDLQLVLQTISTTKNEDDFNITFEYRILAPEIGTYKWVRHTVKPVTNHANLVLGIIQDITDEKNYVLEIQDKNLMLDNRNTELENYAFVASHDLQQPLNTILGATSLLKKQLNGSKTTKVDRCLSMISSTTEQMKSSIQSILFYYRMGDEDQFLEMNLNEVLQEVQEHLTELISQSQATIHIANLPSFIGNRTLIKILVQNLMINAIQFVPRCESPVITVQSTTKGNELDLVFTDNGIGIPDDQKAKIFRLFSRLDNESDYVGSGIGLAQVKRIMDIHNGKVFVVDNKPSGSQFICRFNLK